MSVEGATENSNTFGATLHVPDESSRGAGGEGAIAATLIIDDPIPSAHKNQHISANEDSQHSQKKVTRSSSGQDNARENTVQQWIDQKLNGYIIYQNTLKDQTSFSPNIIQDFNKYSADNWFKLPKSEKDEYTALAISKRKALKDEFRDLCQDSSDLSELQEVLDQKIKKVKK